MDRLTDRAAASARQANQGHYTRVATGIIAALASPIDKLVGKAGRSKAGKPTIAYGRDFVIENDMP
jgi:hypothetical protein